jgi:hypothetical protein
LQPDPAPQPIESVPPAELEIIPESVPPEPMRAESEPAAPVRPPVSGRDAAILSAATVRPGDEAPVNGSGNGLAALGGRLSDLGLTSEQVSAVLALSREVIEQAVWEVVPTLAEALIKEEIARLTSE